MTDAFADPARDMPLVRPLNVAANDFVVKHREDDPYGFWWISRQKGQVPEALEGAYTTFEYAEAAVRAHLAK